MTTKAETEQKQLDELDWEIGLAIEEQWDDDCDLRVTGIEWERALCYDGPDIREQLTSPGIYHQRFGGCVLIGIKFHFGVEADGTIVATGSLHPAEDHRGDYYTDEHATIMTARITISPRSDKTAQAIRTVIHEQWDSRPESEPDARPG